MALKFHLRKSLMILFGVGTLTVATGLMAFSPVATYADSPTTPAAVTTVTVTQDQLSSNPLITNHNTHFTNVSIALLTGQAQVTSTYTTDSPLLQRTPRPRRGTPEPVPTFAPKVIQLVSIWTPVVRDSRIDWIFVSATANGQPTTSDLVKDHRFGLIAATDDIVKKAIIAQFETPVFRDTTVSVSPAGVLVSVEVHVPSAGWTQVTATPTVTQDQLDANPHITNHNPAYSNVNITLLDGQAQVSSTYTADGSVVTLVSLWTPFIVDGRVDWNFVSATVNGQATTSDRVQDHRFGLRDATNDEIRKAIEAQYDSHLFQDTAVTVSPSGVAVTATVWKHGEAATPTPSGS
jgi:hypothetical protein